MKLLPRSPEYETNLYLLDMYKNAMNADDDSISEKDIEFIASMLENYWDFLDDYNEIGEKNKLL